MGVLREIHWGADETIRSQLLIGCHEKQFEPQGFTSMHHQYPPRLLDLAALCICHITPRLICFHEGLPDRSRIRVAAQLTSVRFDVTPNMLPLIVGWILIPLGRHESHLEWYRVMAHVEAFGVAAICVTSAYKRPLDPSKLNIFFLSCQHQIVYSENTDPCRAATDRLPQALKMVKGQCMCGEITTEYTGEFVPDYHRRLLTCPRRCRYDCSLPLHRVGRFCSSPIHTLNVL